MDFDTDLQYWVGFHRISGVGSATLLALKESFGSLQVAWEASAADLRAVGLNQNAASAIAQSRREIDLEREMERIRQAGVRILTIDDPDYPRLLREIPHAPAVLYIRGELQPEDELALAMVGTRKATAYGADMARRFAHDLGRSDVTVVSGLALGIDTVAHHAAIDAGGRTIAVLGSGVDVVYPSRNRKLAESVVNHGALVSEYPLGTRPDARNFPARNRIISGLSRGVLVVEAPAKSGALITASFAADQGRDVYAIPGSARSPASSGCHNLIRDGATLVTSARQILEELLVEVSRAAVQTRLELPEAPDERALYNLIGAEPRHIDELCHASGLPIQETSGALVALELKGLVRQQGSGYYVRI
ncbi:MAG: DNA-processing protein DprA [Thermomicrobiales bacterium]